MTEPVHVVVRLDVHVDPRRSDTPRRLRRRRVKRALEVLAGTGLTAAAVLSPEVARQVAPEEDAEPLPPAVCGCSACAAEGADG